jgi:regulatory protein
MGVITALEPQRRTGRTNIFIDGEFALGVQTPVIEDQGLRVGQEITEEELKALTRDEERRRAINNAVRMLESRSRSRTEILNRLTERGYQEDVIDVVIAQLERAGLIDDQAFAKDWVEVRSRGREPVGKVRLKHELKLKGISTDLLETALSNVDANLELDQAIRAARRHTRPYSDVPGWMAERQRLIGYLQRRGYGWETTSAAIRQVLTKPADAAEEPYEDRAE